MRGKLWHTFYKAKGFYPTKIEGDRYRLHPRDRKFWLRFNRGNWEHNTLKAFDAVLMPDTVYLDVGAWMGPTALFAAKRCKMVYAIEPDPVAYLRLLTNISLNRIENIISFHGALAAENGILQIGNANSTGFGDSMSRIEQNTNAGDYAEIIGVDINRLLDLLHINKVDFIKMDIEGAEFDLLPTLDNFIKEHKPTFYLSLHPQFFPEPERKEKIAKAIFIAEQYKYCYDHRLNAIEPKEMLADGNVFCGMAYLFSDTKFF